MAPPYNLTKGYGISEALKRGDAGAAWDIVTQAADTPYGNPAGTREDLDAATYKARQDAAAKQPFGVDWNGIGGALFGAQPTRGTSYNKSAWGASRPAAAPSIRASVFNVPGQPNGTNVANKDESRLETPYSNSAWGLGAGTINNPAWGSNPSLYAGGNGQPVSLTVSGGNHAYNNPGWGAVFQRFLNGGKVGAAPGNGGLNGNMSVAPGIKPQGPPPPGIEPTVWAGDVAPKQPSAGGYSLAKRPGLPPFSGWNGAQHNGASTFAPRYSSGGYLFDAGGVQIGRDPNFRNRPSGSRGTAAGSDNNSKFETTAIQRANYDRQGISY